MLTLIGLAAIALVPAVLVVGLLLFVEWVQRRRNALVARQIAVTDAIHQELGAVVAPVARWRGFRGCEVRIAVPLERPDLVGPVASTARRALSRMDQRDTAVPIVLVPRPSSVRR